MASDHTILVGMSGGVDSSVAAALLRRQGYHVIGVFLCMGRSVEADHDTSGCCSPQDGDPNCDMSRLGTPAADARRVAQRLGIDLFVLDASAGFARLIDDFIDEYARGRTPNPCIHCNARIKFARLLGRADELGAEFVATGHHARLGKGPQSRHIAIGDPAAPDGRPAILRSRTKDQSYALMQLPRDWLGRILLPIGELADKAEVRRIAAELGLEVADKPDSQEICFAGDDHAAFLLRRRPGAFRAGPIIDAAGRELGRHDGVGRFTIGQRRGLGVATGKPVYVTRIDAATATVTVGPRDALLARGLRAIGANWHIDPPPVGAEFDAIVQIRYNHEGAAARVRITGPDSFEVQFAEPVLAVTPGQAAGLYDGRRLLGGGWIE